MSNIPFLSTSFYLCYAYHTVCQDFHWRNCSMDPRAVSSFYRYNCDDIVFLKAHFSIYTNYPHRYMTYNTLESYNTVGYVKVTQNIQLPFSTDSLWIQVPERVHVFVLFSLLFNGVVLYIWIYWLFYVS